MTKAEESKLPIDELLYQKGYQQAEKDLALTWQDMHTIVELWFEVSTQYTIPLIANANRSMSSTELDQLHCEEVLRRFNEIRK